ncbi:MAG: hypothetical protein V4696_03535 [Pseudomonadota bacterium]
MQFWRVAMALLMFKGLELSWDYGVMLMGANFEWTPLILMTVAWFVGSAALWTVVRSVAETIARDRALRGPDKD